VIVYARIQWSRIHCELEHAGQLAASEIAIITARRFAVETFVSWVPMKFEQRT
jgi:hypothetical protein